MGKENDMKTPAEKCAERICKQVMGDEFTEPEIIRDIIQSEHAETFKVAREAMEAAGEALEWYAGQQHIDGFNPKPVLAQLRTAFNKLKHL